MSSPSSSGKELAPPAAETLVQVATGDRTSVLGRTRIGLLVVGGVVLLFVVDSTWDAGFIYAAVGAAIVAVALDEYARLVRRTGTDVSRPLLVVCGVALFLVQWAGWAWPNLFPDPWVSGSVFLGLILMGMLTGRVLRAQIEGATQSVAVAMAGLLYIPVLLGFLTAIRIEWGMAGLVTVVTVCKIGSSGAYFAGKSLGRAKLAPAVSPNKTVAGAVGAVVASVAAACALSFSPWAVMSARTALLYGVAAAIVAMLGDLAASLLKRQADLKDSARMLPGVGGMLDIVDDVLFLAPVSYLFFRCFCV
ncbi:MAG: phosphatidate cytidylyltransferase [Candidatus Brocadiae bacterium]|nr:phosphatidate cytidylyltransferase [Candidatus Brocadiia bacterium]